MSTSLCTLGNDHIYPGIECFHGIAHRTHHVGDHHTTWSNRGDRGDRKVQAVQAVQAVQFTTLLLQHPMTRWYFGLKGSKTEVQQAGLIGTCTISVPSLYHLCTISFSVLGMLHVFVLEATTWTNMNKIEQAKSLRIPPWTPLKIFSFDHPPAWSLSTAHLGGTPTAQMNNLAFSATMMSMSSGKWPEVTIQNVQGHPNISK